MIGQRVMPDARLSFGSEYTPFAGHALERLEAPVAEAQSGANHQVFHRAAQDHHNI
jgi:hypothetical protein